MQVYILLARKAVDIPSEMLHSQIMTEKKNEALTGQALGGRIRAEKLSPGERSEIARAAAEARWSKVAEESGELRLPRATHVGNIKIGDIFIPCAVLEDGTRLITQRGMFVALGMNKNPSKGQTAVANRPGFLSANNLTPFIKDEITRSWAPFLFAYQRVQGVIGEISRSGTRPRYCRWPVTSFRTRRRLEFSTKIRNTSRICARLSSVGSRSLALSRS